MNRTARRLIRMLDALQPCPGFVLERAMWNAFGTKDSTVRGARKRLERRGLIRCAGHYRDGVKKWELAKVFQTPTESTEAFQ